MTVTTSTSTDTTSTGDAGPAGSTEEASLPATSPGLDRAELRAALAEVERATRRPRWPGLLAALAIGAGGAWAAITYLDGRDSEVETEAETVALATAPVEQRDLLEEIEWTATLGYGQSVELSGIEGTVTEVLPIGTVLERGDVVSWVDGQPVTVFYGDTPMWRTIAEGSEGIDVFQVEANLVALGHDPEETVDIDTTFTANTALMVARWQESLGVEPTGEVTSAAVAMVAGPSSIVSTTAVGSSAAGQLGTLTPRRSITDVVSPIDGVISGVAGSDEPVGHGDVLYLVDEVPVVALTETDGVSAALVAETFTYLELEQALADAGHDPDGEMTVDGVVTEATEAAVLDWQQSAGLPETGVAEPGYHLVIPEGRTVEAVLIEDGTSVFGGGPILRLATSELSVEIVVDVGDGDEFEVGQPVSIELADESVVDGEVIEVGAAVRAADPQGTPTVTVSVGVLATAEQELIEGPVTVLTVGERIEGATVVPTRSLLTLAEGGFAVEKVEDDGSTTLVGVELGTFDDGMVEVVAGDISPDDSVVVPQ